MNVPRLKTQALKAAWNVLKTTVLPRRPISLPSVVPTAEPLLREGELFDNTYRLTRLIGEGAMGAVYEATHARLAGRYAVKLLLLQPTVVSFLFLAATFFLLRRLRQGERRVKVQRRRQIDPTTCERDYSDPEIEFMQALEAYKRTSGRMFPTCSEILEVLRDLGYVRMPQGATPSSPTSQEPAPSTETVETL
jgi:serine/threonine protein kinase